MGPAGEDQPVCIEPRIGAGDIDGGENIAGSFLTDEGFAGADNIKRLLTVVTARTRAIDNYSGVTSVGEHLCPLPHKRHARAGATMKHQNRRIVFFLRIRNMNFDTLCNKLAARLKAGLICVARKPSQIKGFDTKSDRAAYRDSNENCGENGAAGHKACSVR